MGQTSFPAEAFANSPLLQTIIRSLHIDNSTVTFTIELSILTKLLPHLAIKNQSKLRAILPDCLTILARVVCWRTRVPVEEQGATLEDAERRMPSLREDLDWEQLGSLGCYSYLWALSDDYTNRSRFNSISPS